MSRSIDRMNRIIKSVDEDDLGAMKAVGEITAAGDFLAIGRAASAEYTYPVPAQTAVIGEEESYWTHKVLNKAGTGAPAVVRAGKVGMTAVLCAFGGDINVPNERIQRELPLLTSPDKYYPYGTFGWRYDPEINDYIPEIHRDLLDAAESLRDDQVVGAIDFVRNTSFNLRIPNEPGNYASLDGHETRGSLPVRMRDVRWALASTALRIYDYEPLPVVR